MSENNLINEGNFNYVEMPIVTHPWHRFFARTIDLLIISFFTPYILLPLFMLLDNLGLKVYAIVFTFITLFISLFIEAALIALFGTTLGKLAFGIRVLTLDGKKLTYKQGLNRSFWVWVKGLGAGIPVVSLITQISAFDKLSTEGSTSWDQNGVFVVYHKEISKLRAAFFIILYLLIYLGSSFMDIFL